ncbi:hypothetical protein GF376_03600 [Candidatus Peregrinibacteria bacterium]|nr:hypothetical protein [Candidatus Peregrinibacteria bacterium]
MFVVKVGTNVLCKRKKISDMPEEKIIDPNRVLKLSSEISDIIDITGQRVILVASGAIAAGQEMLRKNKSIFPEKTCSVARKQALAMVGQAKLMELFSFGFSLSENPKVVAGALMTHNNFNNDLELQNFKNAVNALPNFVVPILNENDAVATDEITFGDNDQLAALVAANLNAKVLALLTTADGVFVKNKKGENDMRDVLFADLIDDTFLDNNMWNAESNGGMRSKCMAAKLAAQQDVNVFIGNWGKNSLEEILVERKSQKGTWVY